MPSQTPAFNPFLSSLLFLGLALTLGCNEVPVKISDALTTESPAAMNERTTSSKPSSNDSEIYADVLSVTVTGTPEAYQFAVTIQSPDTGCDQYSNWWEVVSEDGLLLHRRILFHSHVNEQPFTRSSGPVTISADQVVIVRAHMDPSGYGGQALQGSVTQGFNVVDLGRDFAVELAQQEPLPAGCNF